MAIRAIVFDIGGVLEITPKTGWNGRWEERLRLRSGELNELLMDIWRGGSVGALSEEQVAAGIRERLGFDREQLDAFLQDLWDEYLGTPNAELIDYFAGLRPRFITGILSNSFAGARRREQERYGFGDLCDQIIYSHEEGIQKPDPRFFALAGERLGVRPEEMIFVDNVPELVAAARAAGINGLLFSDDNARLIADIEACLAGGPLPPLPAA